MMSKRQIDSGMGQLKWVVLLLGVAVILPCVCLLWFMSEVVGNERLASRQKVLSIKQQQLTKLTQDSDRDWSQNISLLSKSKTSAHPYESFLLFTVESGYDGLIVFDNSGKRVYPSGSERTSESDSIREVERSEFSEGDYAKAAKLYHGLAGAINSRTKLKAILGYSRCMDKLGRRAEAIKWCRQAAYSELENKANSEQLKLIANARLLLLKYTKDDEKYSEVYEQCFNELVSMVYSTNKSGTALSSEYNLFLTRKVLEVMDENRYLADINKQKGREIKKLVEAEELALQVSEAYSSIGYISKEKQSRFEQVQPGVYGMFVQGDDSKFLIIKKAVSVEKAFLNYEEKFKDSGVSYRVVDENDEFVYGLEKPDGNPFATDTVSRYLPGWRIELFIEGDKVFEKAASEQIAVYIWTAGIVILLIFVLAIFAVQALTNQIKVNRLKNDFIATVSHELKTPLASMRILVDTLLEGNYEEEGTVTEYLKLVSNENERLSRLIDNFLSFSRMERNKQAFEMVKLSPVEIANTVVEAMRAKFHNGFVNFDVRISKPIGMVYADKDAMVTVLVNLLDNAYKYSNSEKLITFKVFEEDGSVFFVVEDNGIGIAKRQQRKIFNRFYQVDSSLTRRAEGTGLGLSIVKFIVNAHNGRISVQSRPGKGSVFTVKMTAIKNGNNINS